MCDGPRRLCGVHPHRLGTKEAEIRIIGCDLHAVQQAIAMLDRETGENRRTNLEAPRDGGPGFLCRLATLKSGCLRPNCAISVHSWHSIVCPLPSDAHYQL